MFNPEKLLGGLIKSGMRGKGLGSMATGGAALGLVGVAMAAAEHYLNRPKGSRKNKFTFLRANPSRPAALRKLEISRYAYAFATQLDGRLNP